MSSEDDIVARLRLYAKRMDETRLTVLGLLLTDAADEIERLRAERDEARRRLCLEWMEHGPVRLSKEQIAMRYGWDCFKENTDD